MPLDLPYLVPLHHEVGKPNIVVGSDLASWNS